MNPVIVVPLAFGCGMVIATIALRARRGAFHVPGYAGSAVAAFGASLLCGFISGRHSIIGSPVGIALSVLCFLFVAASVGSVLALALYRSQGEA